MLKTSSRIHTYPPIWAKDAPGKLALIQADTGRQLMYRQLVREIEDKALRLLHLGVNPGDRVVSILPLDMENVILLYACAKVGAIYVPLDLQANTLTLIKRVNMVAPKVAFLTGTYQNQPYPSKCNALIQACSPATIWITYDDTPQPSGKSSAISWTQFNKQPKLAHLQIVQRLKGKIPNLIKDLHAWSPLLLYFQNGTDKAVLLCHENVLSQTVMLHQHTRMHRDMKVLVNQPVDSLYCFLHGICSTLTLGGTAVLTQNMDPYHTLGLLNNYCISYLIQAPENYQALWNVLPPKIGQHPFLEYSLILPAVMRDQPLSNGFIAHMQVFSHNFGTGLSFIEAGGFVSFCPDVLLESYPHPHLAPHLVCEEKFPLSIKDPMDVGGNSGKDLADGKTGFLCIHPPNVFLGYYNQPRETGKVLSKEGILHTQLQGKMQQSGLRKLVFLHQPSLQESRVPEPSVSLIS